MSNSPFLPGTQIQYAWDSTSLGWFKECPRLYYYNMIRGLRAKKMNHHLYFGIMYHEALEMYDRLRSQDIPHDEAVHRVVKDAMVNSSDYDNEDNNKKTRQNFIRSIIWHMDHYEEDNAETVQLSTGQPAVELSFRFELDVGPTPDQPYVLCGHLDRVVEFLGDKYVLDYKTTQGGLSQQYFAQYSPDNQMSLYILAAKVIYNVPLKSAIIDAAQLAVGFTDFGRQQTHRTDAQLNEWLDNTVETLSYARSCADRNVWPMNDKSCHKYGGCAYRKICSQDPAVRENFIDTHFEKNPWNPLETREA